MKHHSQRELVTKLKYPRRAWKRKTSNKTIALTGESSNLFISSLGVTPPPSVNDITLNIEGNSSDTYIS